MSVSWNAAFTGLPHDERVVALVVGGDEDLRYDDENAPTALGRDAPRTLDVRRILARPVGTLYVALLAARLPRARPVCIQFTDSYKACFSSPTRT